MSLAIATICTAISNLNVPGVEIKNLYEVPEAVDERFPTLYPEPSGFVSEFTVTKNSFGTGMTAMMTVTYNLTYTFCFAPVSSERTIFVKWAEMVEKAFRIYDTIIAACPLAGSVETELQNVFEFGPVSDPAGNTFHGCKFIIHVTEFVN